MIGVNEKIGYYCATVTFVFLVYSLYLFYMKESLNVSYIPKFLFVALLLHPAWTISAIKGDCGYFKRDVSYIIILVAFLMFLWQYIKTFRKEIIEENHNQTLH